MLTVRYRHYFVGILLPGDSEENGFSPAVKISHNEGSKPLAMLYVPSQQIGTKEEKVIRGFELGAKWIDETLPYLCWPEIKRAVVESKRLSGELDAVLTASRRTRAESEKLLCRSRLKHCL